MGGRNIVVVVMKMARSLIQKLAGRSPASAHVENKLHKVLHPVETVDRIADRVLEKSSALVIVDKVVSSACHSVLQWGGGPKKDILPPPPNTTTPVLEGEPELVEEEGGPKLNNPPPPLLLLTNGPRELNPGVNMDRAGSADGGHVTQGKARILGHHAKRLKSFKNESCSAEVATSAPYTLEFCCSADDNDAGMGNPTPARRSLDYATFSQDEFNMVVERFIQRFNQHIVEERIESGEESNGPLLLVGTP